MRRKKHDAVPRCLGMAPPEVRATTSLHEDCGGRAFGDESRELSARESVMRSDPAGSIGDGDFEDGLRQIEQRWSLT